MAHWLEGWEEVRLNRWLDGCEDELGLVELKTLGIPPDCEDGCLDRLSLEDGSGVGPPLSEVPKDGAKLDMPAKTDSTMVGHLA